jgi:hypothetical protein
MMNDHPRISATPATVGYLLAFANVIGRFNELATVATVPEMLRHEITVWRAAENRPDVPVTGGDHGFSRWMESPPTVIFPGADHPDRDSVPPTVTDSAGNLTRCIGL